MLWLLAGGSVWGVSLTVLAWLFHRAPMFDENERAMASEIKTATPRDDVRMRPRAAVLNRLANSGATPPRHRSFRLTRQAVLAPALPRPPLRNR
jgi:hypothetical protein